MGGRAGAGEVHELLFVLRCGHARERTGFRVRQLCASHHPAQTRQVLERTGHAHLLAGGAYGDAGAPAQPVGARLEAHGPALSLVELTDQHQQTVGGGIDVGGEFGDLVAESLEVGEWRGGESCRRGDGGGRGGGGGGELDHTSILC